MVLGPLYVIRRVVVLLYFFLLGSPVDLDLLSCTQHPMQL